MNATPLPGTSTNLRPGMQSNTNQQRLGVGVQRQQQSRCKANVYGYRFIVQFQLPRNLFVILHILAHHGASGQGLPQRNPNLLRAGTQQRGNDSSNLIYSNQASFHKCILKLCYVLSEVFNTPQHHYNHASSSGTRANETPTNTSGNLKLMP